MSPFNLHPVTEQPAPHQHDSTSHYPPRPMRPNTSNPYTHTTQPLPTSHRLFQPHNPSQSHNITTSLPNRPQHSTLSQASILSTGTPNPNLPQFHQPVLLTNPKNEPWGNTITKDIPNHIFRVLSCNVNTINPGHDFLEWQAAAYALYDYSVSVACLQETNTQWTLPLLNHI